MKKIILLLLLMLTFGCSAEYNLNISEDNFKEELILTSEINDIFDNSEYYNEYLDEYPIYYDEEFLYYSPSQKLDGVTYYEKNIDNTEYGYRANYKANFTLKDYNKSRILNNAFENYNIGYDKKEKCYYIIIQNLKIFNYNNTINSIVVNIDINDFEIIESNANIANGSVLTWNFYKSDDNKNDRIILKYQIKSENKEETQKPNNNINNNSNNNTSEEKDTTNDLILVLCGLVIFGIAIVGIIVVSKKVHK